MKANFTIILFSIAMFVKAQEPTLTFTYDPLTGNQAVRTFCQSCGIAKHVKETETETAVAEDPFEFSTVDKFTFYPNPVKEELFLKWELINENHVTSITVTEISGQTVAAYQNLQGSNTQTITFRNVPTGVYLVTLAYQNAEQKTLKIIKQ